MKHIKKLAIILVVLVIGIGMSGCGNKPVPNHVDLTTMSETSAHEIVTDMFITRPDAYVGTTIKAIGEYAVFENEGTDETHHFIWIGDGESCCRAWLDFYYSDIGAIEEGTTIMLEGVFSSPTTTANHFHVNVTTLTIV